MNEALEKVSEKVSDALTTPLTDNARDAQDEDLPTLTEDDKTWTKKILDQAWKLVVAAVAAIGGFAGFVTLTGTALLWERFDQAGIPAEQALGKVPAGQVTLYGAEALIIAVLLGIAAIVVVWALDRRATVSLITTVSVFALVVVGIVVGIDQDLGIGYILVLAAFGVLLAVGALGIADRTSTEFVPFAAAIVVATALFNLLLFFLVTEKHVPVTPAAVVQPDGTNFTGYYVADGTDNIYLAVPTGQANDVVFREIPRTADTDLGIGHTVDRDEARPKLDEALRQLQEQPARKPAEEESADEDD